MEMNNEVMTQEEKKTRIKVFIARLTGYVMFGLVFPFSFLVWRFGLFQQTSKLNIGGWGIVAIIFAAVFFAKLLKQAGDCVESVLVKQIFQAIGRVFIPLLAVTLCLYAVGDFWKELINFFIILTICEPVAYVLNPFPEYIKEKDEKKEDSKILKVAKIFWSAKE